MPIRFKRMIGLKSSRHSGRWTRGALALSTVMLMLLVVPTVTLAQVSSNEINYFSRCREMGEDQARLDCYDRLYDQALRAITPRNSDSKLQEENRRMREELARIRQQTGSSPATVQPRGYGRRAPPSAPANVQPRGYSRRDSPRADDKLGNFGKPKPRVVTNGDGKEILYDRIADLQKIPTGWSVTLASGQVWRQMYNKRYNLRVGQEVKISPTIWGDDYHLAVKELGGFIQVKRIQ